MSRQHSCSFRQRGPVLFPRSAPGHSIEMTRLKRQPQRGDTILGLILALAPMMWIVQQQ